MSTLSPNLGLVLTEVSDTEKKFLDFRTELTGSTNSNMTKIDDAVGGLQSDVEILQSDIVNLQSDVENLQDDVAGLQTHVDDKNNPHSVTAAQVGADPSGSAEQALSDAKQYTDEKIEEIPVPDVSAQIQEHNDDPTSHGNILSKFDNVILVAGGGELQVSSDIGEAPFVITADDESDIKINASSVLYDNAASGLAAENIQDAINEVVVKIVRW